MNSRSTPGPSSGPNFQPVPQTIAGAVAGDSIDVGAAATVVIPFKRLDEAKTRLRLPGADRRRIALAMACDTLAAVADSIRVGSIIVVTGEPEYAEQARRVGARVLPDPGSLNLGLQQAAELATGAVGVLALLADLPALAPAEVDAVLAAAQPWLALGRSCFVADSDGLGTSAYAAPQAAFRPRFGPDSAARHRAEGAIGLLGDWPGLRLDVDDREALDRALAMGVGAHTRAALGAVGFGVPEDA